MKKFAMYTLTAGVLAGLSACGEDDAADVEESNGEDETVEDEGESLAEQLEYTITGIDAGAGIMESAEQAIEDYDLEDYRVQSSSSSAMSSMLSSAFEDEEPIVVTGWTPHWKFEEFDLKYLDDPEQSFGEAERIHTIAREGLEEDMPEAYEVLDNFYWEPEHIEAIMVDIYNDVEPEDAAREWIEENEDIVSEWTEGVDEVEGEEIEISFVAWDSEIASTNMIGLVLEDMGYDVELTAVEGAAMWESVATDAADATVAAWLPETDGHYYEQHEDNIDDLGANLEDARVGLVVPEFVEAESIGDLAEE
ncbi:glycine betaine/proline transport system substrate-binding protein [Salsuginibacillus halophilus]|uniref:Glycine betaine/proline transport system substrate-binding protein n=1 Tax=Salsuginibacillus halophilus TaxID=517424 RepID=A0A2P8H3R1_9BACI|nr:glycine betaine ABC transporter substrate-binding protein [Salsuginibacillus halophilus]PSL40843.1 glycine betaine/proline transport system substrate-binding protein [Salsuginibacillus halophilus]